MKKLNELIRRMNVEIYFKYMFDGSLESHIASKDLEDYTLLIFKNNIKAYVDLDEKLKEKFDITEEIYNKIKNETFYIVGELENNSVGSLALNEQIFSSVEEVFTNVR